MTDKRYKGAENVQPGADIEEGGTPAKKVAVQSYFKRDEYERLRRYAFDRHISIAEVVRTAVSKLLDQEGS